MENVIAEGSCRKAPSWNKQIKFPWATRGQDSTVKIDLTFPSPFCFCFYFQCWIKKAQYILECGAEMETNQKC